MRDGRKEKWIEVAEEIKNDAEISILEEIGNSDCYPGSALNAGPCKSILLPESSSSHCARVWHNFRYSNLFARAVDFLRWLSFGRVETYGGAQFGGEIETPNLNSLPSF
jgi:hypothetical protein